MVFCVQRQDAPLAGRGDPILSQAEREQPGILVFHGL